MRKPAWGLLLLTACGSPPIAPAGAWFDATALYSPTGPSARQLLEQESLTMDEFLSIVDRLHPAIAASRQRIDIAAAEAFDAGLYPNPSVEFAVEDARTNESGSWNRSKRTFGVSQEFSLTGKFAAARAVKERERERRIQEFRLLRRSVLMGAKQAFLDYLSARARLELLQKIRGIVKNIHDLTQAKFENQAAPEIQVLKSSVRLAIADANLRAAEKQVQVALKTLHVSMGNYDLPVPRVAGTLATAYEIMSLDALRGQVLANHPRLEILREEKAEAQAELESARADAWPNLKIGLKGGIDEMEASIVECVLEIPLPVFQRQQGRELAAELRIREVEHNLERERNDLLLELTQAHTNLVSAQERVQAYLEEVLPKARKGLEQAEMGFQAGEFSLLDVLDSQTTLAESEQAYLAALEDLNRAATDLEKLSGKRLRVVK